MLLEYPVHFDLFYDGRLNPEVRLEEAGDCGANTLLLLGLIELEDAVELSKIQNECWRERHEKIGIESTPFYLFQNYLFKDHSKQYEIVGWPKEDVMNEVKVLQHGYGTFIFMKMTNSDFGHYICFFNDNGDIQLADLQTEEIIKNDEYEPDRLDTYLSKYDLFYIPYLLETPKRVSAETPIMYRDGSPVKSGSPAKRAIEESALIHSNGSPSKTIPSPSRHLYRSPEKVTRSPIGRASEYLSKSPLKGHASEHSIKSPPRLIRSRRDTSYENVNAFEYVTPSKKSGGRRKRRTRRKN
jgi:hypothetical protein